MGMDVIDVTGESRPAPPPKEGKGYLAKVTDFIGKVAQNACTASSSKVAGRYSYALTASRRSLTEWSRRWGSQTHPDLHDRHM